MAEVEAKRKFEPFEFIANEEEEEVSDSLTKTFVKRLRVISRKRLQLFVTEIFGFWKKNVNKF